jgi:hypothetical protein
MKKLGLEPTRLHGHEGAPGRDGSAVEETRDHVAGQQDQVSPVSTDICRELAAERREAIPGRLWRPPEKGLLLANGGIICSGRHFWRKKCGVVEMLRNGN